MHISTAHISTAKLRSSKDT